jgi:Na+/H+ antiporter NhaC
MKKNKNSNPVALVPILVFLVLYLGTGIIFEYVMKIPMGFYNVPIIVAFMAAILVACMQNSQLKFDEKLDVMAKGLADRNIVTMLLIFITAGIFVGVVGRSSAESVAYFMLSIIPAKFAVAVLFIVACFVSTAMGTSVGTITHNAILNPDASDTATAIGVIRVIVPTDVPIAVDTKQATIKSTATANFAGIMLNIK